MPFIIKGFTKKFIYTNCLYGINMVLNFFNSMEHLEPKCPNCKSKVEYGVTTKFDDSKEAHVCINCGNIVD